MPHGILKRYKMKESRTTKNIDIATLLKPLFLTRFNYVKPYNYVTSTTLSSAILQVIYALIYYQYRLLHILNSTYQYKN